MKYYRVKTTADNKRKGKDDIYIKNELYTPREVEKFNLNMDYLEPIEVSKKRVYFSFGARFAY